jgi:hypothetical protein
MEQLQIYFNIYIPKYIKKKEQCIDTIVTTRPFAG